jgi:Polyketide cyclase / dehydrase and lipid transport
MRASGNGQTPVSVSGEMQARRLIMATVRKEFRSARSADEVWTKLRRFDAVHELAPGFVTATKMEPSGARVVTFANGMEIREWLVSSDDGARRLVYAILDHPKYQHYSACAQVFEDGQGSRFEWTVDFLPDAMAGMQDASMTAGAAAMAKALG